MAVNGAVIRWGASVTIEALRHIIIAGLCLAPLAGLSISGWLYAQEAAPLPAILLDVFSSWETWAIGLALGCAYLGTLKLGQAPKLRSIVHASLITAPIAFLVGVLDGQPAIHEGCFERDDSDIVACIVLACHLLAVSVIERRRLARVQSVQP